MTEEFRPDIPTAADLVRLLDWTINEALALRHASAITVRERRRIVELLQTQSERLKRAWKRLSWRFEGPLVGTIGLIVQFALPEYLEESSQVLSATEMAGAFPDTERWRALYEALTNGLKDISDEAAADRRLTRELARRAEQPIWPLVGFADQAAYEETFSPSFAVFKQRALEKRVTEEEKRLLKTLLERDSVAEAELVANGITRETIMDIISALAKEKLVSISDDSQFTLSPAGKEQVREWFSDTGDTQA